jgi:ribosomal protein L37E
MIDDAIIDYILNYYSRFMTLNEYAAMKHYMTSAKFSKSLSAENSNKKSHFLFEKGWLSGDSDVTELLKDGYQQFRKNVAQRILKDNAERIYHNYCAKCGKLARTPRAKQCRQCGYSWHKQVAATFQIASTLELTGQELFFIVGDILDGDIKVGMKADLIPLGLAVKPIIKAIRFFMHNHDAIVHKDIGLGFNIVSNQDKELLKSGSFFGALILIEDENAS